MYRDEIPLYRKRKHAVLCRILQLHDFAIAILTSTIIISNIILSGAVVTAIVVAICFVIAATLVIIIVAVGGRALTGVSAARAYWATCRYGVTTHTMEHMPPISIFYICVGLVAAINCDI